MRDEASDDRTVPARLPSKVSLQIRVGAFQTVMKDALRGSVTPKYSGVREQAAAKDFGTDLFNMLIAPQIQYHYYSSLDQARADGFGLRLKLRILVPELAALPWEFMFDPRHDEYVGLSAATPIVRAPEGLLGMTNQGLVELGWVPGSTWRDIEAAAPYRLPTRMRLPWQQAAKRIAWPDGTVNAAHAVLMRGKPREISGYIRAQSAHHLMDVVGSVLGAVRDQLLKFNPVFKVGPEGLSLSLKASS